MSSYNCCISNTNKFKQISQLSLLLKLIGEENRLKLLCLLEQGEHCVCKIIEHFDMSQSLVSHHLSDLKEAGLLIDRKQGRKVYYSLSKEGKRITDLVFSLRKKRL